MVLREPGGDGRLPRRAVSQEDNLQLTILVFPAILLRIRHDGVRLQSRSHPDIRPEVLVIMVYLLFQHDV